MKPTSIKIAFLVFALAFVQASGLHGHIATDHFGDANPGYAHTHWADRGDFDHDHVQALEIDVIGVGHVLGRLGQIDQIAIVGLLAIAFLFKVVLTIRIPSRPEFFCFRPPRFLRPSLRGPPA